MVQSSFPRCPRPRAGAVATLLALLAVGLLALAPGCGRKESADEPGGSRAEAPLVVDPQGGDTPVPAAGRDPKLCIDPADIQIEPLDLEALDDELLPVHPAGGLEQALAALAEHGSLVVLDDGRVLMAFVRCAGSACEAGVVAMAQDGTVRDTRALPGVSELKPGARLQFVTGQADVNSNGTSDLWLGYRTRDEDAGATLYHVAAFSLPALTLQWHGVISRITAGEGCEGTLYPVDADCDGNGDLVLVQRCGPVGCLNDDSGDCAGARLEDRARIYLWNADAQTYAPRP